MASALARRLRKVEQDLIPPRRWFVGYVWYGDPDDEKREVERLKREEGARDTDLIVLLQQFDMAEVRE
jgi:hypothetical protein